MKKKPKPDASDEETLRHYTSLDKPILPAGSDDSSKLTYIKPELSVDHTLSKRKRPVIKEALPKESLRPTDEKTDGDNNK